MTFKRTKEDFVCENCRAFVHGDGYTDHCPYCLYSRHVDKSPGDRECKCGGLMKPVRLILEKGVYKIEYICLKCGYKHKVKAAKNDNIEILLKSSNNKLH